MKIAFLGTGLMGEPMAQRLLSAGNKLSVFNRTTLKTERLCQNGATLAFKPIDAIHDAEVVITMLTDYTAVCDVLFSSKKISYKDKTVIQMSTISPDESLLLKGRVESLGGEYLEAPVLGSIPQAADGTLIIMVGSTEEQYQKHKNILEIMGNKIVHVGEVGKGSAVKLALNQLIASLLTAFSMSLGYVREKEIDVEKFMDILRSSVLYAPTFDRKLSNFLNRDFSQTNFPLKHLLKDVNIIINQYAHNGIDTNILKKVKDVLDESVKHKYADQDYTAFYNVIHPPE